MNFWMTPVDETPDEVPPPRSLDDYGVVIPMKRKKRPKDDTSKESSWMDEWQVSETGTPICNVSNLLAALRKHPPLRGIVCYDEMQRAIVLLRQIPDTDHDASIPRALIDSDVVAIQEVIQHLGLKRIAKPVVQDGLERAAAENRRHPVKSYLNGIFWDGKKRVGTWLCDYLGVAKSDYAHTIGQLFLVALIARQYNPGCKADYMLILEGPQGAMKSSACRAIAGEWFDDNLPELSRGDAVRLSMHLRGKWLIEIGEMSSFSGAEAHTLKAFLTQTHENYVPKFGRNAVSEARQCLFIGSTNEGSYLKDATGGRRFWPVKVGEIKLEQLTADRDQLLAEAVALFRGGAKHWPDRDFEAEHIKPEQEARYDEDPWQPVIANWLLDSHPVRTVCTSNGVMEDALFLTKAQFGVREQKRVAAILQRLGFERRKSNGAWGYHKSQNAGS